MLLLPKWTVSPLSLIHHVVILIHHVVIARESGRSSNHETLLWARLQIFLTRRGYWMPRFHPKSALADFGTY
jgi:hypothetical protein